MWVGAGSGSSQLVTHAKYSGSRGSLLGSTQSIPRASQHEPFQYRARVGDSYPMPWGGDRLIKNGWRKLIIIVYGDQ
jgi:hypothetical protein